MVRSQDYLNPHARYSWGADEDVQARALSALTHDLRTAMQEKLLAKMCEGYSGWDDPAAAPYLWRSLRSHLARAELGDPEQLVDCANLIAMLWNIAREADSQRQDRIALGRQPEES